MILLSPLAASRSLKSISIVKWWLCAVLAGLLLVAHGCHGNEDHELVAHVQAAAIVK